MSKTIDGVPRELLERLQAQTELGNDWDEVQALLAAPVVDENAHLPHQTESLSDFLSRGAAPVVERQEPVAWMALNRDGFPEKCLPSDPEGFPVYRSAPARRAGDPVGFRYRTTNGPWELMDESPYADGRIRHCCKSEQLEPLYAEQPAPVAVVLPNDWQDQLFSEMERRFDLRKQIDDDHMVNDDTQVGVEFARDWIAAQLDKAKELNP